MEKRSELISLEMNLSLKQLQIRLTLAIPVDKLLLSIL